MVVANPKTSGQNKTITIITVILTIVINVGSIAFNVLIKNNDMKNDTKAIDARLTKAEVAVINIQDKKLDKSVAAEAAISGTVEEESFKMSDLKFILKNKGWWYIALLCVLFYSAVFPFLKYASDLMVNKFGVNPIVAGTIPSLLPFGTILLTPLFGSLYDRKGKGATLMIIGAIIIILVHTLFSVPFLNFKPVAIVLIITLGIDFFWYSC